MWKLIVFLAVVGYLAYRVNSFWLKIKKAVQEVNTQNKATGKKKVRRGEVEIEFEEKPSSNNKDFQGGDYVDFEEVDEN